MIESIYNLIKNALAKAKAWHLLLAPFAALITWFTAKIEWINAQVAALNVTLASLQDTGVKSFEAASIYWDRASYFFPLNYAGGLCVAMIGIRVLCSVVRIVKSFIPTIS